MHENGVTYLYTGFSSDRMGFLCKIAHINITGEGSTVVRLGKDMLTIEGEPKMLLPGTRNSAGTGFEGHEFYEAMSMRKFGEKYYAVYSSVLSHELCYAVSDRPDGGFQFGGPLHSNGNIFGGSPAQYYWGYSSRALIMVSSIFCAGVPGAKYLLIRSFGILNCSF